MLTASATRRAAIAAAAGALAAPTLAQSGRVIRLIVPFSAGGNTDVSARILARGLSELVGQEVVVENRVGAGTTMGTDTVAKAAPGGYTLLFTTLAIPSTRISTRSCPMTASRISRPWRWSAPTPSCW